MKIIKKLFLVALSAGLLSVPSQLEKVEAADQTIYLKAGCWDVDGAIFWGHFWGAGDQDVKFLDTDGDGVYEASVKAGQTNVIFTRNKSGSTGPWDNEWNRIQTTMSSGKNCFKVTDWGKGSWESYSPSLYLAGEMNSWATDNLPFTNSNGSYELETYLDKGTYEFKLVKGLNWYTNGGTINDKTTSELTFSTSGNNTKLVATGGKYTFTYNYTTNKLTITYKSYEEIENEVKALFDSYNADSYTKDTVLNVNKESMTEIKKYFHNGAQAKYRKTVYTQNDLTMSTSDNGITYTGDSRYYNEDGVVKHDGTGGKYTVSKYATYDEWFVTLNDFVKIKSTKWTVSNGVYSLSLSENETMTTMAREFVAPMWLTTDEAKNYVKFDKLTVEEVDDSLVMKLYVVSGNSGQLETGANLVFSQATITI